MADEILSRDQNHVTVLAGITDDADQDITMLRVDPTTKRLLVKATGSSGGGVTSLNSLTGAVILAAGSNITLTPVGNTITIAASGGSGSPGGSDTQVQYNNAGSFGGITGATTNGTTLTLVAPVLGTPASVTLTNATGLPISSGVSGLGAGVATFLATPSSANLASAVTGETGSGALVFGTSPDFTTGATIGGVAIPTISSTNTFTNKRITKRVVVAADATSITPNTDNADWTEQANTQSVGTLTINADAGTPTNKQAWGLEIKSTNIQTFSWNGVFVGGATALPTATTGGGKIDFYTFVYSTTNNKWVFSGSQTNVT